MPLLIVQLGTDPRDPDVAEVGACCALLPLALLGILFIIVGIARFANERANKNMPSINSTDN